MDPFHQAESTRLSVRKKVLCGSNRTSLCCLIPEDGSETSRQLDRENVARLIKIFDLEGCLRLEPTYYVPAFISREHFQLSAQQNAADPPTLTPSENLKYLQGQVSNWSCPKISPLTRLLVGSGSVFWGQSCTLQKPMIDDINGSWPLKDSLRDKYSNARNFFDGDIYCRIRTAHLQAQRGEKRKWLARLSKSKQRDVLQLEGRAERPKNPETRQFNEQLDCWFPLRGFGQRFK